MVVKEGTFNRGDWIVAAAEAAAIKIMANAQGQQIERGTFSQPVRLLGFSHPPEVGAEVRSYASKYEAVNAARAQGDSAAGREPAEEAAGAEQDDMISVSLVIKADVLGSLEAIEEEMQKVAAGSIALKVLKGGAGDISDDDIKSAAGRAGALVVGFKVKAPASVLQLAERLGVGVQQFTIIYELLEWFRGEMERRIPPVVERTNEGTLTVLKIFKRGSGKMVLGGRVLAGTVRKGALFEAMREKVAVGRGTIAGLQQSKVDASAVSAGNECGILAQTTSDIRERDTLVTYTEEIIHKKLGA